MHADIHVLAFDRVSQFESLFVTIGSAAKYGKADFTIVIIQSMLAAVDDAECSLTTIEISLKQTPPTVNVFLAVRRAGDCPGGNLAL